MAITEYTWNPITDSVIEETDGTSAVTVTYTSKPQSFGPLVSQNRQGITRDYHYDALGSMRLLTDTAQAVTDASGYDAWGNLLATVGSTTTPLRWGGRWGYMLDTVALCYSVRRRAYNSVISRWMSVDPELFADGYLVYRYATNSPATHNDPSGRFSQATTAGPTFSPCPKAPEFSWTVKWSLDIPRLNNLGEDPDGFVFQKVTFQTNALPCAGTSLTPIPFTCTNTKACSSYYEMWRSTLYGFKYGNTDTFGHLGFIEPSKGDITISGDAFYVELKNLDVSETKWIGSHMNTGAQGAIGACDLPSICIPPGGRLPENTVFASILKKATKHTKKDAVKNWNCCPCQPDVNSLVCTIDGTAEKSRRTE